MAFGVGILLFFSAERDPSLLASTSISTAICAAAIAGRHRSGAGPVLMFAATVALGFTCAAWRAEMVKSPVLQSPVRASVTGIVDRVEPRARGYRLWLTIEAWDAKLRTPRPARVRAVVSRKGSEPPVGSRISLAGLWRPPPGPVRPGGYDWSREAYFMQIGAVGIAEGTPKVLDGGPASTFSKNWSIAIAELRQAVAERINGVLSGSTGAIATSLVVGERGPIPERINEDMRVSGLTHILSISGLHIALFAGVVFWAIRVPLAFFGTVALRYQTKKWAAIGAACAAYGYLLLSGSDIAAQRSFLMALIAFIAIVWDRVAVSIRSVGITALILMLIRPELLLSISFQMSFAAVLGLVAIYEIWRERALKKPGISQSVILRFLVMSIAGMAATTLVAGFATAPFGAFYFQQTGIYSMPANLIVLPIVSSIIMPSAVAGLILLPLGLDAPLWMLMGLGIDAMTGVAHYIAELPGAALPSSAFSMPALLFMVLALCWACLWRTVLRWGALLPLGAGVAMACTERLPDVYIEPEGRAVAVRHPDGQLRIAGIRFARFAAGSWLAADADARDLSDKSITSDVNCDRYGCSLALPDGRIAILAWTYRALKEDCHKAALIVTRLAVSPQCRTTAMVIDGDDLAKRGAIALTKKGNGFNILSARLEREQRPWINRPDLRAPSFPEAPDIGDDEATGQDPDDMQLILTD